MRELGRLARLSEASADLDATEGCLVDERSCGSEGEGDEDEDEEGMENHEADGPDVYEFVGGE